MGFFGSLIGWDQSNGAVNAVLASYLIEKVDCSTRIKIAKEVANIIASVQRQSVDFILQDISKQSRVVQMNFIALACDNLYIDPPIRNNVWSRVENPYRAGDQIDDNRISAAVYAIEKQDGARVTWPGNTVRVDFRKMYDEGSLSGLSNTKDFLQPAPIISEPQKSKTNALLVEYKNPLLEAYRQYLLATSAKQLPASPFKQWMVQYENKNILDALSIKYFGAQISFETYAEARQLPQDQLISDGDFEVFGDDFIDFCLGFARYEIARFKLGFAGADLSQFVSEEVVNDIIETCGEEIHDLMKRVALSVLAGKNGLFIDSTDEDHYGVDLIVLVYRIALFSVFDSKEQSEIKDSINLVNAIVEHQINARSNAVDSDVLPNGYGPFGLSVTNPIPTHSAKGSNDYISKLRTIEDRSVESHRIGSTSAPVNITKAMIDMYILRVDGQNVATIYICPYHKANSSKAPEGFTLSR